MALTFDLIYASLKDENAALREAYTKQQALILQLVEALEHTHRCVPMGGFAQIHWGSSTFEQIVQAAEAGRAWLEGKPCA